MITVTKLDIKFLPYALNHAIQLYNSFPAPNKITSTIDKVTSKRKNLSFLRTFGCCVYMRPPVKRKSKLKNHVSKGIFLVYDPHTTQNVL